MIDLSGITGRCGIVVFLFQKRLPACLEQAGAELGQAQLKLGLDFTGTELGKMSGQILTNLKNSSYS